MTKRFQHAPGKPFHISVGAVLVNDKGLVCVHKLERATVPEKFDMGGIQEGYILMRESLENDESLEAAVLRGIREEFAAEGEIVRYLGTQQILVPEEGGFEKTTLYFQIRLISQGERDGTDEESFTTLEWVAPEALADAMRQQGAMSTRLDWDESKIIEAYLKYR